MIEIRVPTLGESVTEATVTRWLKKEGDPVAIGDVLLELETEKVNLEVGNIFLQDKITARWLRFRL